MEFTQLLKRGFEYDYWANRRWIDHLGGFKSMERPLAIIEHILSAQHIWLEKCGVELSQEKADWPLEQLFDQSRSAWVDLLSDADTDTMIEYQSFSGSEYVQPLGDIALHVINHGTYHRGHLRGLADAEGWTDFPETDLALFLREK